MIGPGHENPAPVRAMASNRQAKWPLQSLIELPSAPTAMADAGEMKAVHIADLADMLGRHGQLEDFEDGRLVCSVCSDTITLDNAGSLRLIDGKVVLACRKFSCYDEMVRIAAR